MKKPILLLLLSGLLVLGFSTLRAADKAPEKTSPVQVTFGDTTKFTDFKEERNRDATADGYTAGEFIKYLQQRAPAYLAAGQKLEVKFLDIDLAGEYEPWRGPQMDDVRIMKDIYAPRMTIQFRLLGADGKVIAEGERQLSNLSYLMTGPSLPSSDTLRYDKEMLGDWLHSEFRRK